MLSMRHMLLVLGIVFLLPGCAMTQKVAKTFIDTQKKVDYKLADYADPAKIVGGNAVVYQPALEKSEDEDTALLQKFAPIIVQGVQAPNATAYSKDSDELGEPELARANFDYNVTINVDKPVLYSSVERTNVRGHELKQLVYVDWYPRKPVGGIEKGEVDGGVPRVTLDAGGRPSIFEYVAACGCWHGVFVGEHLEAWAQSEFPQKVPHKHWFVEMKSPDEDSWQVRDIIHGTCSSCRPVVFISAGRHECLAIQSDRVIGSLKSIPTHDYAMEPYDNLNSLAVHGGTANQRASMFNSAGLVWGAQRKGEEKLFSNLDHGGWPRRLDAMKIHWDEQYWNDSHLLEKFLRLPGNITRPNATATPLKAS